MLLYAECLANDGDLRGAMELVNKIRKRASLDVNRRSFFLPTLRQTQPCYIRVSSA